jgi:hypothetical protein
MTNHPNRSNAHQIEVDIWSGVIGSHGFRKGHWNVKVDGKSYRMYASIPHAAELDSQRRILEEHVRNCLRTGRGLNPVE